MGNKLQNIFVKSISYVIITLIFALVIALLIFFIVGILTGTKLIFGL